LIFSFWSDFNFGLYPASFKV